MLGGFREQDEGAIYAYFFCTLDKNPSVERRRSIGGSQTTPG